MSVESGGSQLLSGVIMLWRFASNLELTLFYPLTWDGLASNQLIASIGLRIVCSHLHNLPFDNTLIISCCEEASVAYSQY